MKLRCHPWQNETLVTFLAMPFTIELRLTKSRHVLKHFLVFFVIIRVIQFDKKNVEKKILVIDDDKDLFDVFLMIFKDKNYELKFAGDIFDLDSLISDFQPNLILLDIWIGKADGRVVCNYLKSHENTVHIPVILISAELIDIDDAHCTPDAIVQKPFDIHNLLEITGEFLD